MSLLSSSPFFSVDEADSDGENDEEELETVPSRHAIAHMRSWDFILTPFVLTILFSGEKQQQTSAAIYHSQAQMHAADVAHGDEVSRGRRTVCLSEKAAQTRLSSSISSKVFLVNFFLFRRGVADRRGSAAQQG